MKRLRHAAFELNTRLRRVTGYEIRKSDSTRRVALLRSHGVDLVLDVGAASGEYGKDLRSAGYNGDIVSFEPLSGPFQDLSARARRDRHWQVFNVALGEYESSMKMNVAGNRDSSSLLPMLERHNDAAPYARYVGVEQVQMKRLDDIALDLVGGQRTGFLKIDVQGYEREVLSGGKCVVSSLKGIQLEMSLVPLYEGGMLLEETLASLSSLGFKLESIELGFRDPQSQELLQADGVFFRRE